MNIIKPLIAAVIIFLVMDLLWLGIVAKGLYIRQLGPVLRLQDGGIAANWGAACIVYITLVAGLMIFVITQYPQQPGMALLYGALFGLVTYATYDFTNLAVLKDWTLAISVLDTIWGMVICGVTSWLTVWICK